MSEKGTVLADQREDPDGWILRNVVVEPLRSTSAGAAFGGTQLRAQSADVELHGGRGRIERREGERHCFRAGYLLDELAPVRRKQRIVPYGVLPQLIGGRGRVERHLN